MAIDTTTIYQFLCSREERQKYITRSTNIIKFLIDMRNSQHLLYNSLDSFKMIRIALKRQSDMKPFLKQVLEQCNLSTENIDKIKATSKRRVKQSNDYNVYSQPDGSINEEYDVYMDNLNRARIAKTLRSVLHFPGSKIDIENLPWQK